MANKLHKILFMNNPLDYLWYKLYKVQKSFAGKSMAFVLLINSLTLTVLLLGNIPKWVILFLIAGLFIINHYEKHEVIAKVLKKYRCESRKSRIIGNIIVTVYIILSFIAPLIIAKFKNGYIFID
ncbi:MAG: hypothetical protein LBS69_06580 [Prevotellaceae bacterium]|jgi:hypothetical protein|nr:hypothetical protein [Prevotellaceae bacterium]